MFAKFRKRSHKLERLDTGDYTAAEYDRWQYEMRFIHRIFGEGRALRKALLPEIMSSGEETISLLDIGAGSGELLRMVENWLPNRRKVLIGADLNVRAVRTMRLAGIKTLRCDAFRLPFADDSFDHVICSLFLHHLTNKEGGKLLAEMGRVARRGIIAIDLHRSPVPYYFYLFVGRFFLQKFTREDGSLSILRSFKPGELHNMACQAGLKSFTVARSAAYRLVLSGK
ncbi:MAG: methyltransferase domain-containing protein [Pyrinomonadaceae bacterium]